ncbi:MAG: KH domain-containing protein [Candidatus Babeliaceae bacterium]|nr:KH domain-containing protein [Candidatus Babeliaceae bacterium]
MIEKLVERMVKQLVTQPEAVLVSSIEASGKCVIQVRVASEDIARVIGSEGRIFRALKTIVTLVGAQQNRDIVVDIAR